MTTEITVLGDSDILEKERGQIQGKESLYILMKKYAIKNIKLFNFRDPLFIRLLKKSLVNLI